MGGRTRRSLAVGLLSVIAALAGCKESSEPLGPTATVPQATTTTNPFAVPAVIDEAYVNRVLAGLDHAVGDVTRLIVNTRTIPPEAIERLQAVFLDSELLQTTVDIYQEQLIRGFPGMVPNPGNQRTTVVDLITAGPECIFAQVDADITGIFQGPDPRFRVQWISLIPTEVGKAPSPYNPAPWGYIFKGLTRDFTAPDDPCSA